MPAPTTGRPVENPTAHQPTTPADPTEPDNQLGVMLRPGFGGGSGCMEGSLSWVRRGSVPPGCVGGPRGWPCRPVGILTGPRGRVADEPGSIPRRCGPGSPGPRSTPVGGPGPPARTASTRQLERPVRGLGRADEILRKTSASSGPGGARPPVGVIDSSIHDSRADPRGLADPRAADRRRGQDHPVRLPRGPVPPAVGQERARRDPQDRDRRDPRGATRREPGARPSSAPG